MTTISAKKIGTALLRAALLALCLALMAGTLCYALDPHDNRILEGVTLGGLELGGMSPEEAYKALTAAAIPDLTLKLPQQTLVLSMQGSVDAWSGLWAAWQVGRFGNQDLCIGLSDHLTLNHRAIRTALSDYAARYDTVCTPSHYRLAGEMPDLEREQGDPVPQTLELTLGLPTARLDQQKAMARILAAYDNIFAADTTLEHFKVDILEEPPEPDLNAIYEAVYIPPVDDSLDLEKHTRVPGAWGYRFDPEAAQTLVDAGSYGEVISIPMELETPEIHGDLVYFRDVLGYCETKHTQDENRNNNLRLAAKAMDGLILQPGDVFSYNDTLGPRTKETGYLRAGAYSGWELVLSYGGGICQGSSTIYGAVLQADLEVVQRKNHGYMVSYVKPGLDATVNWGGPDFQFRNSSHFPIKIAAQVSDGMVKVTILGTEERDYYVVMESEASWGSSTIYAKSYKCKYDRQTDELLSRELEAKSNYMQ